MLCWAAGILVFCDTDSFAQQSPVSPPPIRPMRQLEDYRYLAAAGNRQGAWWERLKYIPIGESPYAPFLTFGGEVRLRYELIDNTDFGSGPQDNGGYLLTRFMPYAALTLPNLPAGWELQLFAQFEAAFSDYDERGPGPIDQDDFDVIQAFAKISVPLGTGALSFQGGRQEISFGTERLLGTRYGPNVPLSFDGGLVRWQDPDAAAGHPYPSAFSAGCRRMLISDVSVRWTGHFAAISISLSRCSALNAPVRSTSTSILSSMPSFPSHSSQSFA